MPEALVDENPPSKLCRPRTVLAFIIVLNGGSKTTTRLDDTSDTNKFPPVSKAIP
jgi:hypothetical protein